MAKRQTSIISDEEWERHKVEIISLYRKSNLESVIRLMNQKHGFYARYVPFAFTYHALTA
jgi:hypothetical protein